MEEIFPSLCREVEAVSICSKPFLIPDIYSMESNGNHWTERIIIRHLSSHKIWFKNVCCLQKVSQQLTFVVFFTSAFIHPHMMENILCPRSCSEVYFYRIIWMKGIAVCYFFWLSEESKLTSLKRRILRINFSMLQRWFLVDFCSSLSFGFFSLFLLI